MNNDFSVSEIQQKVRDIYSEVNLKNNYDLDYFYGYLTRAIAAAFKAIRYERMATDNFVRALSFLFSICEKSNINLQDAYLRRFPNICPYCLENPCRCVITKKASAHNIPKRKLADEKEFKYNLLIREIRLNHIVVDFEYCVDHLHALYPDNITKWEQHRGSEFHISKVLEELGEVHEAYARYIRGGEPYKSQFCDEIADLFAWLISSWKLSSSDDNFTDAFNNYYKNGCPNCHSFHCLCMPRNDRSNLLFDKKEIEDLLTLLNDLSIRGFEEEIENLKNNFKYAIQANSATDYKICILSSIQLLAKTEKITDKSDTDMLSKAIDCLKVKI